jgi:hypothetical protein
MPECLHGVPLDTNCEKCLQFEWDQMSLIAEQIGAGPLPGATPGGPGGSKPNVVRNTTLAQSPSGPFNTGTTDGLVNSLEARIEELEVDNERLQKLWKSAAGHGETCSVLLARIEELEKENARLERVETALCKERDRDSARITELEAALKRADERDNDWNDLLQHNRDAADAAEARIAELEGALRDIAEGGFANEAAIQYRARAALRGR